MTFSPGDCVQTPLGKGVVREVRTSGRLLVIIGERSVVVDVARVKRIDPPRTSSRTKHADIPVAGEPDDRFGPGGLGRDVDLHGLVVVEALARVDAAVNEAILAGYAGLRLIHGRSGGRIRAALHRHLREVPSVRTFRLDPANEGVTIVRF